MSLKIPNIFIGTAGWSYKDWVSSFYPKAQSKNFNWLEFYAEYFNVVEVNSSYYTYLTPQTVKSWTEQIENRDEFLFTVKLHMDFTHTKKYDAQKIKSVKQNLDILKNEERLGGLLLQFPYSFDCSQANIEYMRRLIEIFDEYEKFVEVRHKSWQNKKAKSITFCTIDQPQIGESIEFNPTVGNKKSYLRFHGRNEQAWFHSITNFGKEQTYDERSERYKYLYSPGELAEISIKIKEVYDKVNKIFVIMNNHPNGDAVANAFELLHYLKEMNKIKIPATTVNSYLRLKELATN